MGFEQKPYGVLIEILISIKAFRMVFFFVSSQRSRCSIEVNRSMWEFNAHGWREIRPIQKNDVFCLIAREYRYIKQKTFNSIH